MKRDKNKEAARRYAPRRWQFDGGKNRGDLRPPVDGWAVRTSIVAGGGSDADSQRAYSLGSCAVGQTDGRIALFQNAPPLGRGGHKNTQEAISIRLCAVEVPA